MILVGTQCDLRNDVKVLIQLANYNERPVSEQEARNLASRIGALNYIECSALTQKNLKEVFDAAILAAMDRKGLLASTSGKRRRGKHKTSLPRYKQPKTKGWKKMCCFL